MSILKRTPSTIFVAIWFALASQFSFADLRQQSLDADSGPVANSIKDEAFGKRDAEQIINGKALPEPTMGINHDSQWARYLWETDGKGVKNNNSLDLARYLWDEEKPSNGIFSEILLDVPLDSPSTPTMSKYLWDKDGAYQDQQLARYLWDEDSTYQTDSQQQVTKYLWDEESTKAKDTDVQIAKYLWDEESVQQVETDNQLAKYLWDEDSVQQTEKDVQLAKYLWDEDESNGVKASYIISGKDFEQVKDTLLSMGIEPTHEFGIIRSVAANLTAIEASTIRSVSGIQQVFADGQGKSVV